MCVQLINSTFVSHVRQFRVQFTPFSVDVVHIVVVLFVVVLLAVVVAVIFVIAIVVVVVIANCQWACCLFVCLFT